MAIPDDRCDSSDVSARRKRVIRSSDSPRKVYVEQLVATDGVESATQVDVEKVDRYAMTLRFRTQPASESRLGRRQVVVDFWRYHR